MGLMGMFFKVVLIAAVVVALFATIFGGDFERSRTNALNELRANNPQKYLTQIKETKPDIFFLQELRSIDPIAYEAELSSRGAAIKSEILSITALLENDRDMKLSDKAKLYDRLSTIDVDNSNKYKALANQANNDVRKNAVMAEVSDIKGRLEGRDYISNDEKIKMYTRLKEIDSANNTAYAIMLKQLESERRAALLDAKVAPIKAMITASPQPSIEDRLKLYEKLVKVDPDNASSYASEAKLAEAKDIRDKLTNYDISDKSKGMLYKRLAELEPKNKDISEKLATLTRKISEASERQQRISFAIKHPDRVLSIGDDRYFKPHNVLSMSLTIGNSSPVEFKDIKVSCTLYAPSGTILGDVNGIIYEKVLENSTKRVNNIAFGHIHPQTDSIKCEIALSLIHI